MGIKNNNSVHLFFIIFLLALSLNFLSAEDKSKLPTKYKKWIEEEVVYIITPAEKEVFLKLETDKQRDLFIKEFWRHRDPTPGTIRNEFKEEHYRRIEYVKSKKMWGQTTLKNSWRTDRGRIYITLGPPQHIEHYSSVDIYPAEIWYYQGNPRYGQPSNFRLLFFKRHGGGEFVLYNPILDGPRNLTPLAWMCSSCSTDDQFDAYAYQLISQNVSIDLASASLSLFPGQGRNIPGSWGSNKKTETNSYVYDYQLVKKGWNVVETRKLLEENGEERNEKNAVLKTQMFYFRKPLFRPTGLLSRYWQERLDYKLLAEEILNGEKVLLIEAVPNLLLLKNTSMERSG